MVHTLDTKIIEALLPQPVFGQSLYHYTSPEALLNILESGSLHSSHIYFMNDYEENLNLWKHFFNCLESWPSEGDIRKGNFIRILRTEYDKWQVLGKSSIENDTFKHFEIDRYLLYVFSFSYMEDDLSQWRAYGSSSYGFSLKFQLREDFISGQKVHIDPIASATHYNCKILIRDCVYETDEKIRILNALLDFTFERFMTIGNDWHNELFFNLLTVNIFFKNEKFACEKECRIAILPFENVELVEYKKGKSFLIPYLKLDITHNILKEVCVGPSPFPTHSIASLRMLLKKYRNKYGPVGATTSTIPYRSW